MKRVIIDVAAIKNNYDVIRQAADSNTVIYWVVKGNAYGLDTKLFVSEMIRLGARHFACADVNDAVYIKSFSNDTEVLLLTPVNSETVAQTVLDYGIVATVENKEGASLIGKIAKEPYPVHIKVDVGFGRYGVRAKEKDEIKAICQMSGVRVDGIFTHLPKCADKHTKGTFKMIDEFFDCVDFVKNCGIEPKMIHALGSVGVFRYFDERFTAVRVGSAITGRMPLIIGKNDLIRVAALECSINSIKAVKKGDCIGYSSLYKAKSGIVSAVLDVGYADGFGMIRIPGSYRYIDVLRHLKHDIGELVKKPVITAKINGKKVKVVGGVGMTSTSFDVTGLDVDLADMAEIDINPIYISPDIQRVYIR